jgi:hypothetical protein
MPRNVWQNDKTAATLQTIGARLQRFRGRDATDHQQNDFGCQHTDRLDSGEDFVGGVILSEGTRVNEDEPPLEARRTLRLDTLEQRRIATVMDDNAWSAR